VLPQVCGLRVVALNVVRFSQRSPAASVQVDFGEQDKTKQREWVKEENDRRMKENEKRLSEWRQQQVSQIE
jgi:hypothetical protein